MITAVDQSSLSPSTHANAGMEARTDNVAFWLPAKLAAWRVGPAPHTPPGDHQIVIRNHAVAINPVDWLTQSIGGLIFPWITYPTIGGWDVAGEVVDVGAGVSRFKVGDRILGQAVGQHESRNRAAEGGFQLYPILLDHMAAPIPDGMSFEDAAVLPLGLSTAACALFEKDQLALARPAAIPVPTGKTLLVWGGSTSVGSNAIQLAVASGYEVIATASPKNFAYVKGLGAAEAFDYRSKTVTADIVKTFTHRTLAGAVAIGHGSTSACIDIVGRCAGDRAIAVATPPVSFNDAPLGRGRMAWLVPTLVRMMIATGFDRIKSRRYGIRMKSVSGSSLVDNDIGAMIYADYLPAALAEGRYVVAPDPLVIGHGLTCLPDALAAQKRGVSARKLVVTL